MDPICAYLVTLPSYHQEADLVRTRANWFILYDRILYRQSFAWPLLHFVTSEIGKMIWEELHERLCSFHIGRRTLAVTAIRTG